MDVPLEIIKGAVDIYLFSREIKGIPAEVEECMHQIRLFNSSINRLVNLRDAHRSELSEDSLHHHQEVIIGAQEVLQEVCAILARCDPDIVEQGGMSFMSRLRWKVDVSSEFKSMLPRVTQHEARVVNAIQDITIFNHLHPIRSEAMRTLRQSEQIERERIAKEDDIGAILRTRTGSFYNPPLPPKCEPKKDENKRYSLGSRGEQPQSLPVADPVTPRLGGRRSQLFKRSPKPISTDAPRPQPVTPMPLAAVAIQEEEQDVTSPTLNEKRSSWWRKSSSLSRSSSDASSQSHNQPQILSYPTSPTENNTPWQEKRSPEPSPKPDLRHRVSMLSFKRKSQSSFQEPASSPAMTVSSLSRSSSGRTTVTHSCQCNCGPRSPTSPTPSYSLVSAPTSCASTPSIPRADLAAATWPVYNGGNFNNTSSQYFGQPSRPQRPMFVSLEDRINNGDYQLVVEDDEDEYAELAELP